MGSKARPRRTEGSRKREKIETEEFLVSMEQRHRNWAMYIAVFLTVVFATIVLLQSLGYSHLPDKPFYAIIATLLAVITYVVRAAFK
jgi:high-affinity Fe2+/Pb2+ permease